MSDAYGAPAESLDETGDPAVPAHPAPRGKGLDVLQMVFWLALSVAGAAAGMALTWREAVGPSGAVLLIALGAMGLVLALWLFKGAGRKLGLFPERGAAEAAAAGGRRFVWLEALEEPALISDRGGATVAANPAYMELAQIAREMGDSSHAPSVDRLFGAIPGMAAPIYRLAKAAKAGQSRSEVLPAILLGEGPASAQFEATVAPLGVNRALWRLRRADASAAASGAVDPRALYVEDSPVGFFSARRDGRVVYVNQALRQMLGLPEEPAGLRMEDIMRPEGLKLIRREIRGQSALRADVVMRARDGVEIPAQLITTWSTKGSDALTRSIVYVAHAADGKIQRPTGAGASVGQPTAAAAPTARPDDVTFLDAPFGVVRLDGDSVETAVMLDANRSLMDLTEGRSQPGARFADLFAADQGPAALAAELAKALDGAVGLKLPLDLKRWPEPKVATENQKSVDVFIALDKQGRPSTAYVIDTTEKKQTEAKLMQGEKLSAVGAFAGGMAHDFNNLLQGLILNVNQLQIRHPPGDPSFFELRSINEYASRGAELVRMLLAYSRQQVFRSEVFDVSDVLTEYYILLRGILDERIKLDIVHGRDLPLIEADKLQVETALTNLCTNARDAMIEKNGGGHLTIRTSRADAAMAWRDGFQLAQEGEYLLIEVIDDGAGIKPELIERIFQPFYTTKDQGKGTGLGLATVYGIVKQSKGYIYPVSKLGRGTTFKIFLPAFQGEITEKSASEPQFDAPPPPPSTRGQDLAGKNQRILYVEDEDGIRGIAVQLLASCGYQVVEAADGEKALDIVKENKGGFDLVISDVVMPGMDGPTLLREARPWLGKARVMFVSGYAERDLAKALEQERQITFLPKPFTLRQLAERVKAELAAGAEAA
jgi:two-component system cell cycle sensor histidine kinase/response regulator CckA